MKTKTKAGIGIALAVLMVAALAAPAAAEYDAEDTKMNIYKQGFLNGNLNYTYGDEFYKCINTSETATYNIDISHIQWSKVKQARLYVYWTWGLYDEHNTSSHGDDVGIYPVLNVTVNSVPVSFDYAPDTEWIANYTDAKTIAAVGSHKGDIDYVSWNFPSGTNCSKIPRSLLNKTTGKNVVTVTNVQPLPVPGPGYWNNGTKVCIQGVGLLVAYESDKCIKYWVAEGNDMTYVYYKPCKFKPPATCYGCEWSYGRTPDMATTKVTFPGAVPFWMNKATLTSVIPAGDSANNRLYFNNFFNTWSGQWFAAPNGNLSVSVTDVSDNLLRGRIPKYDNVAGFQNGLSVPGGDKQMNVATAILVVEHDKSSIDKASLKEMRKVGQKELLEEL